MLFATLPFTSTEFLRGRRDARMSVDGLIRDVHGMPGREVQLLKEEGTEENTIRRERSTLASVICSTPKHIP